VESGRCGAFARLGRDPRKDFLPNRDEVWLPGVKPARVPWAEPGSRFTILFERFAIDLLQATQAMKGAQEILRTNWDQTWNVVKRAVARGLERNQVKDVPRIGIDKKVFRKGHDYVTLLVNLDTSTVEVIADGNDTESANACAAFAWAVEFR
jgi:transposase